MGKWKILQWEKVYPPCFYLWEGLTENPKLTAAKKRDGSKLGDTSISPPSFYNYPGLSKPDSRSTGGGAIEKIQKSEDMQRDKHPRGKSRGNCYLHSENKKGGPLCRKRQPKRGTTNTVGSGGGRGLRRRNCA